MRILQSSSALPLSTAALLFFVPLVPFHFLYFEGNPLLSKILRFSPFFFALAVCCVYFSQRQALERWPHPAGLLLGSYFCFLILNSFSGTFLIEALGKAVFYFITGELLCYAVGMGGLRAIWVRRILAIGLFGAAMVCFYGILEVFLGLTWLREALFSAANPLWSQFSVKTSGPPINPVFRAMATFGNSVALGGYLIMIPSLFLHFFFYNRRPFIGGLALLSFIMLLVVVFFTFARGAWIGLFIALFFYLLPRGRRYLLILCVGSLAVLPLALGQEAIDRRDAYGQLVDGFYTYHRTVSIEYATQILLQRPLIGVGLGSYRYWSVPLGSIINSPDNMLLMTVAETGTIGLIFRLGIFVYGIIWLRRCGLVFFPLAKDECQVCAGGDIDLLRAIAAGLIGFTVNMLTWDGLYFPVTRIVFWTLSGLCLSLARSQGRTEVVPE